MTPSTGARNPVLTFYLLAFAISWVGFAPVLAASAGVTFFASSAWKLCLVLPACGPAVAAAVVARRLRTALRWRADARWYLAAILAPAALLLAAQGISRVLFPDHSPTLPPASPAELLPLALMAVAANPWEEVGWRVFATTRLQQRFSALTTAIIVGVLWGLWHIPLFLWPESPMSRFPFRPWFLAILGQACILAWLYNRTSQSLAIASVFHVAGNIFGAAIGIHSHTSLAMVNLAAALALVWRYGTALGLERNADCVGARDTTAT